MYRMQSDVYSHDHFFSHKHFSVDANELIIMGNMAEGIVGKITRQEAYRNLSSSCL